jgi:TolB-like protein
MTLFRELNRRNVVRVGAAYLAVAWLAVQVAETVLPLYGFGDGPVRALVTLLAIGFLPCLVFAWVFEITPTGLKLERDVVREESITPVTGRKLDRIIIVVLGVALTFFVIDRFMLEPGRERTAIEEGRSRALLEPFGNRSIAVLPFTNMSDDSSQDHFSDGISEELLNLLAKVPQLRVISRSSSFAFKGMSIGVPELARQLKVDHVLEGSVRRAGNKVRITAQLIDARTDAHVWSVTYDRAMNDIFAIQDEIAAEVVGRLEVTLLGAAPRSRVTTPEAYTLYLKAKELARRASKEGYEAAIPLLEQAVAADPRYLDAWVELATVYINQTVVGLRPFIEGYDLAARAIERARVVDPANPLVQCVWSDIKALRDYDLPVAADLIRAGLNADPASEYCLRRLALLRSAIGDAQGAIDVWQQLNERDPVKRPGDLGRVFDLWSLGRLDEAIEGVVAARAADKGDAASLRTLEAVIRVFRHAQGDLDAALALVRAEPVDGWRLQGLGIVQHALGNHAASDAALRELVANHASGWPYNVGAVYAFRSERDPAFVWLERAIDSRDPGIATLSGDPLFRPLHDDPRWIPLVRKVGQAPEQLALVNLDVQFAK